MLKEMINAAVDAIEDVATAIIAVALIIFIAGQMYVNIFPLGTKEYWIPGMLFVFLLVMKLVKDVFRKAKKKKK